MRYNKLNKFLQHKFGEKVYKVSLAINTTCPNRDGKLGAKGCIYCNPLSNEPLIESARQSIGEQLIDGISYMKQRHRAYKFISYFQQFTNTYGTHEKLRDYYFESVDHPEVVGLAISTRPDCISEEILSTLEELNKKTFLWIELGLQSANDSQLEFLNRGHSVEDFIKSTNRLHDRGIHVCAHVILGLPNESNKNLEDMANLINENKVWGIKIHNLHVLEDTPLADLYKQGKVTIPSLEEYTEKVIYLLERLNKDILIHRFNSHSPRDLTIAPKWSINKLATFNTIENELERRDTWQGKLSLL